MHSSQKVQYLELTLYMSDHGPFQSYGFFCGSKILDNYHWHCYKKKYSLM
jgi:hypothetical protein